MSEKQLQYRKGVRIPSNGWERHSFFTFQKNSGQGTEIERKGTKKWKIVKFITSAFPEESQRC